LTRNIITEKKNIKIHIVPDNTTRSQVTSLTGIVKSRECSQLVMHTNM